MECQFYATSLLNEWEKLSPAQGGGTALRGVTILLRGFASEMPVYFDMCKICFINYQAVR
jgi:hypothetical protein